MNNYLLQIIDLHKGFGDKKVLKGININIKKGEIFGLLGPNGAGKTTLIRIINRIFFQDKGDILYRNRKITNKDVIHIGYLPEERGLYQKLTVWEQGIYFARLKGLTYQQSKKRLEQLLTEFEILSWWNKKIQQLSKGMQQKVQFLFSLLHNPDMLILDEPFTGFDPVNTEIIKQKILKLKNDGKTVIFSTHNMASVEDLCDSIALINNGQVVLSDNIDKIKMKFDKKYYLLIFYGNVKLSENQKFKIISQDFKNGKSYFKIQINGSAETFLQQASKIGNIAEFKHDLPSLHDIFISIVSPKVAKNDLQ